ncbi:helix-turn-helix transcriptional regulator [Pseudoflavonifractor phocaeensis]|uniref:helix-turn-helix domain-containing protein n=1 Tax=Pseudoflavonifractor phocaeensis TaxID=1870988 RepID=UPI001957615A|nr:helix-turn-helix transcriptional regulator [Pseudoflavonifractor phocaeensis]MBM6871202.1 helix-turn-helix transcriptional regulator [Pseudoflavonifractor phocaeensis]MBM6939748.1 helix-turn-helix transcriptional regulator [Pseudoflavonifractor phocaeensis]
MMLQTRLYELRRQAGLSQEELANVVGVSRQAVQKWESGASRPDIDKLVILADYFGVTLDNLVRGTDPSPSAGGSEFDPRPTIVNHYYSLWHYEYRSPHTLFGLPLVHINLGQGFYRAKGIFAVGNLATGFVALGGISAGLLSVGGLSLGLLALGGLAAGIAALGGAALGLIALGAVAVGCLAIGSAALGMWSVGVAAWASRVAIGVSASAPLAIGQEVSGSATFLTSLPHSAAELQAAISAYAHAPRWIEDLLLFLTQHISP